MAMIDSLLTFETPVVVRNTPVQSNNVVLGGLMHRFPTDKSIRVYCTENGLIDPSISDHGAVFATTNANDGMPEAERQIGWIS